MSGPTLSTATIRVPKSIYEAFKRTAHKAKLPLNTWAARALARVAATDLSNESEDRERDLALRDDCVSFLRAVTATGGDPPSE